VAGVRHFSELDCWKLSEEHKRAVYRICRDPQVRADRKFHDQWRDAAASPSRNIAEGFGRRSRLEFARYLDIARASLFECQQHGQDAVDREYLSPADQLELMHLAQRASGAIAALQRYLRRTGNG
jgi:four helix bundle protein